MINVSKKHKNQKLISQLANQNEAVWYAYYVLKKKYVEFTVYKQSDRTNKT